MNGETLFWIGLGVLVYAYLGYPCLLACIGLVVRLTPDRAETFPRVSMIVAACNEASVIGQKIANTLSADYPKDRLELVIVSDASEDETDAIVARHAGQGVVLVRQERRGGKSLALNRGAAVASGEVLVFSDANSMFDAQALRLLVAPLSDARVGAVSGRLEYEADEAGSGEDVYWRYEQLVKALESRLGKLLGANGAIYAIRRELFPQLRSLDVNDFRVPYEALLRGHAVVLVSQAKATEKAAPDLGGEMARKVRIMSRAIPMFFRLLPATLARGRLLVGWELVSHKLLRETQAIAFLALLAGAAWSALMANRTGYWLLGLQVLGYSLGVLGWSAPRVRRLLPIRVATYVTMIAVASLQALLRWLSGRTRATWEPTARA